jgi:hypothetical protein
LSLKTKVDGLSVVWPQNHWDGLSVVWHQNHWDGFLRFDLKTDGGGFLRFSLKSVAMIFSGLVSKLVVGFLIEPQNQGGGGFFSLGLKTDSYGLVIWVSKSPRLFLCLGLKIKQVTVCRLRHKTDGSVMAWDTHRDLAACFTWKQVGLVFSNLPQDWRSRDDGWYTWHHRGGYV